jgi:hypothetical protein
MLEPDLVPQCAFNTEDIVKPRRCDMSVAPDKPAATGTCLRLPRMGPVMENARLALPPRTRYPGMNS